MCDILSLVLASVTTYALAPLPSRQSRVEIHRIAFYHFAARHHGHQGEVSELIRTP